MDPWRFRLELAGPYGTPWASGTLFGQLCWAMVRHDGSDERLVRKLAALRNRQEVFLLSDVLPADLLPRPLLPPPPFDPDKAAEHKKRKKLGFVKREHFLRHRAALSEKSLEEGLDAGPGDAEHRLAHNTIDRQRGTVIETIDRQRGTVIEPGGLWFLDEWWPSENARERDLYVRTSWPIDEVEELLAAVGGWGFGRDSTWGRGRFRILGKEPERELFDHPGNRYLSLSHGCWTEELEAPRYKLATHFGKLAIEAAMACGRPWKRPILLMKPGATFAARGDGPFGKWLEGIVHSEVPEILGYTPGQHAFHLPVPYTEAAHAG
jgi:CRISPR-associated protein Csm4